MKNTLLLILLIFLTSCSVKYTCVEICPTVEEDGMLELYIDTTGSSLTTTTDQTTDGKPSFDINLPLGGVE